MTVTTDPVRGSTAALTPRRGRGPVAAAVVYVGAWVAGLVIPGAEGRSSHDPQVAAAALLQAFPLPVIQAWLVHGVAGVALMLLVLRVLRALEADGRRAGARRPILAIGAAASTLSLAQFATLLIAQAVAATDAVLAHGLLGLIDHLDVAKITALAGLVVVLSRALARAADVGRWLVPAASALAALLLGGASSLLAPAPVTEGMLALSLLGLLAWSVTVAALAAARRRRRRTGH